MTMTLAINAAKIPYKNLYDDLPFKMEKVESPSIPSRELRLSDMGVTGDGITLVTTSIQSAIDELSNQGGGRLSIPAGVWVSGPIELKSHIDLHLESGAVLLFSPDTLLYPLVETVFEGKPAVRRQSPVWAQDATDISISGNGILNGNGEYWRPLKRAKVTDGQWKSMTSGSGRFENSKLWVPEGTRSSTRPVLVALHECKRVKMEGVTLMNSPAWSMHLLMCEQIILDGVSFRNPTYAQNGDGLDVESCKGALIVNCTFDVGDDAICMKSGKDEEGRKRGKPTENVIVNGCTVFSGHGGFVIGSEMSGGIRNISVSNCQFVGTDIGLRFKSTRGRGGVVERIYVNDISMSNIKNDAILFNLYYFSNTDTIKRVAVVDETTPIFRDITIENVTCSSCNRAFNFYGLPEMPIKNVVMKNVNIQGTEPSIFEYCEVTRQ